MNRGQPRILPRGISRHLKLGMARHTSIPLTRKVQGTAALWSLEAAITHYKHRGTRLLWLVLGLYANSAIAQGTCYSFDWHGYSNQFQASFTIPEWSRDPGVAWGTNITDEMSLTAVIKGPSGQWYSYANSDIMASGGVGVSTYTIEYRTIG